MMKIVLNRYDRRVAALSTVIYWVLSLPHLLLITAMALFVADVVVPDQVAALREELHRGLPCLVLFAWSCVFCAFQREGYVDHFSSQRRVGRSRATRSGAGFVAGAAAGGYVAYTMSDNDGYPSGPSFNIDGTPMMGAFDINGNVFGVTSSIGNSSLSDNSLSSSDDHYSSPSFNIDGTPMMGAIDINGHAFGVTDSHMTDSFSSMDHSSSHDSFASMDHSSSHDSFGSS